MKHPKCKRILALLAALALAMLLPTAAMAASDPLVDESRQGSITIHKYSIDSTSGLAAHDGTKLDDEDIPDEATPLKGIEFRVVRLVDDATEDILNGVDFSNATELADFLDQYGYVDPAKKPDLLYDHADETDADGILRFGGDGVADENDAYTGTLPQGVYLVIEEESPLVEVAVSPFLVAVPMTPFDGQSWVYDVHVYPKNSLDGGPDVIKTVTTEDDTDDTRGYYDTITWFIQPQIPLGIDSVYEKFVVRDELDDKLVFASPLNLQVYYYDPADGTTKVYLDGSGGRPDYTYTTNNNTLVVSLTEAGMQTAAGAHDASQTELPRLYIKFDTRLNLENDEVESHLAEEIENTATLEYENNSGTYTEPSNEAEVHYGGVNIIKQDGDDHTPLEGAQFLVYKSEADALAGDRTKAIRDPEDASKPWILRSDENGEIVIWGLPYGDNAHSNDQAKCHGPKVDHGGTGYWLVEILAPFMDQSIYADPGYEQDDEPEGEQRYNLLREPFKITVTCDSHENGNYIEVDNQAGFELPSTGGMGTVLFTLVGLGLICLAVILLVLHRRRGKARQ